MIYEQIEIHLNQVMGLDAKSIGRPCVERALRARMLACGLDEQAYWRQLIVSATETQELIEAVVVPETWFFRDRRSFEALAADVLARTGNDLARHPIRLLSFPCATGEEPYSMTMALLDAGCPPGNFKIDAWDISLRAIACAEQAIFGKNSFRGTDVLYRDRHFETIGPEFRVKNSVRSNIHFKQANVLGDMPATGYLYDVIFCRNMLIYLDRHSQQRAIQTLARLLTTRGTLFVGPSEGAPPLANGFVSARIPGSFAFRRADSALPPLAASIPNSSAILRRWQTNSGYATRAAKTSLTIVPDCALEKAADPPSSATATDQQWLESARQLADAGRLAEAMELCNRNLGSAESSAPAFYVKALLHDALGQSQEAIANYRKALYLDPAHQDSLVQLGTALLRGGDSSGAQHLFDRAARITERRGA